MRRQRSTRMGGQCPVCANCALLSLRETIWFTEKTQEVNELPFVHTCARWRTHDEVCTIALRSRIVRMPRCEGKDPPNPAHVTCPETPDGEATRQLPRGHHATISTVPTHHVSHVRHRHRSRNGLRAEPATQRRLGARYDSYRRLRSKRSVRAEPKLGLTGSGLRGRRPHAVLARGTDDPGEIFRGTGRFAWR